mmetsp:Transcript_23830/g.43804  ORF Transcript_23830/g.43804 Transcript_23830/m.43804 type:complete len:111 (+) Transcript_23830:181-513(+)
MARFQTVLSRTMMIVVWGPVVPSPMTQVPTLEYEEAEGIFGALGQKKWRCKQSRVKPESETHPSRCTKEYISLVPFFSKRVIKVCTRQLSLCCHIHVAVRTARVDIEMVQ